MDEKIKLNESKLQALINECVVEVLKEMKEMKEPNKKINEEKQIVKINESQLQDLIKESTLRILNESDMDEGWLSDKFNQVKTGANTLVNNSKGGDIRDRFSAAKKNYKTQGELNNINNLIKQLTDLVDTRQLNPQTTIAQLIGGKYKQNNQMGTMTAMANNRKAQITNRGGQYA